jgi:hypothetical protein
MTIAALPLFTRPRSPFGHLPIGTHVPDESLDAKEARILGRGADCDADRHTLAMVAAWRARRAAGDTAPKPGCWGEYRLTLGDGTPVTAIVHWPYMPGIGDLNLVDFHGDVSETGYHSHFFRDGEVAGEFGAWLALQAERYRAETVREWEGKRRKLAPKKRPAKKRK